MYCKFIMMKVLLQTFKMNLLGMYFQCVQLMLPALRHASERGYQCGIVRIWGRAVTQMARRRKGYYYTCICLWDSFRCCNTFSCRIWSWCLTLSRRHKTLGTQQLGIIRDRVLHSVELNPWTRLIYEVGARSILLLVGKLRILEGLGATPVKSGCWSRYIISLVPECCQLN